MSAAVLLQVVGNGFWACVESVACELFSDGDDVFAHGVWHGLGVSAWGAGFWRDGVGAAGVEGVEDLVDALAKDAELLGYL